MANVINSLKLGDGTYVFTTPYATCNTAAATAAKVATITPSSNFSLEKGARVAVQFDNANTAGSPTLNVNNTGAKAIYFKNAALTSSNYWSAKQIIDFIYDGTYWVCSAVVTDNNTAHTHSAGVGLLGSGNSGTSGTYSYKAKLKSETANANDSLARPTANADRLYPVEVDKSGYLAVTVPWSSSGTDTKNTTGSTQTSSAIYLVGATAQATYATTYSKNNLYADSNGCLNNTSTDSSLAVQNTIKLDPNSNYITVGAGDVDSDPVNPVKYTKYGQSDIKHTSNGTDIYTIRLPAKSGTLVTEDSYTGNVSFTGYASFHNGVYFYDSVSINEHGSNPQESLNLSYNSITRHINNKTYRLLIPAKSGTLALADDVPAPLYRHEISVAAKGTIVKGNTNDSWIIFTLYSSVDRYNTVSELPPFDMMGWYYDGNDVKGAVRIIHNPSVDSDVIYYSGRLLDSSGNIGCDFNEELTEDLDCTDTVYSQSGDLI